MGFPFQITLFHFLLCREYLQYPIFQGCHLIGIQPLAIQIPIFFALYQALDSSLELRKAAFLFWVKDLSVMDPFFILPMLMGLAMILQQRLTAVSPQSDRTWIWMPVGFALLFAFFPAGLVLFWLTDTLFSVGQLAWITARAEAV